MKKVLKSAVARIAFVGTLATSALILGSTTSAQTFDPSDPYRVVFLDQLSGLVEVPVACRHEPFREGL